MEGPHGNEWKWVAIGAAGLVGLVVVVEFAGGAAAAAGLGSGLKSGGGPGSIRGHSSPYRRHRR